MPLNVIGYHSDCMIASMYQRMSWFVLTIDIHDYKHCSVSLGARKLFLCPLSRVK